MTAPLPDADRPGRADPIEARPIEPTVPQLVVPPRDQPLVGVGQSRVGVAEALVVLLRRVGGGERAAGQHPVLGGDHLGRQRGRAEQRVEVLIDQAGEDDVVGERPVDHVRLVTAEGHDLVEGADGDDAVAAHGDRAGGRSFLVERPDPTSRIDRDHPADRSHRTGESASPVPARC